MSIPFEKTLEDVRNDIFGRIQTVQETGVLPQYLNLNRGPIRGLLELWSWGLYQLYLALLAILKQAFPETATGSWLDLHCKQVGVTRRQATKALGNVTFYREGTAGNVAIPAGRVVKTKPDGLGRVYRYVTTEEAVLQAGSAETLVPVASEDYGREANATAGAISEISTYLPGVDGVTNGSDWLTSEADDLENDDRLRERYFLAWLSRSGITKYAYEAWVLAVSGVIGCTILDRHPRGPGTVDVIVRGAAGIPTVELLAAVTTAVMAERPINDDVEIRGPAAVPVVIDAVLEVTSGSPDTILADVENRLRAIFQDPSDLAGVEPIQVGDDVTRDRLTGVIMGVKGIKRVIWTSPTGDIAVSDDGLGVLDGLHLTCTWAEEP